MKKNIQSWLQLIPQKDMWKFYIFAAAIICSLLIFSYRLFTEQRNMRVETVYDYSDVLTLQAYSGQSRDAVLKMLQKAGITTICLPEDTLASLTKQGRATWISGEQVLNMSRLGQIQSFMLTRLIQSADIKPENFYVMIDEYKTYERAKNSFINELGVERAREVGSGIIEIKGQVYNMDKIGLGVDSVLASELAIYNFRIMPKLVNSRRMDDVSLGLKVERMKDIANVSTLLFDDLEVLGYGGNVGLVAEKMLKNNLNYGYFEFVKQKGDKDLAELLPGRTIGVHAIPAPLMLTLSKQAAVDRYLLAAAERGIRILYVRPFVADTIHEDLLIYNEDFISQLKKRLEFRGFHIEPVMEVNVGVPVIISVVFGIVISFGVMVVLFYFLQLFFKRVPDNVLHGLLVLTALIGLAALLTNQFNQWRSFLALMVAIIAPTYAMITQLPKDTHWHDHQPTPKEVWMIILKIVGITALGILLIIGLLSDVYHMLKVYQFRGVKFAFIIPLMLVGGYYFLYPYRVNAFRFLVRRFLQSQVTVGYVLGAMGVILFIGFYLLRSGNYQMPVLDFEDNLRRVLSYILFVRPRTKEFLIGYPLIVFMLHNLGTIMNYKHKWVYYTIATVAPISLLNTFCHLHAPLWISILRSLNGLVLGFVIGYAFLYITRFARRAWKLIF